MKILVFDLCRKRLSTTIVGIILICVVLTGTSLGLVADMYGSSLNLVSTDVVPYEKLIILDAGHGGEDPGAVGFNGVYEKDLNLQVAMQIGEYLEKEGYVVVYTRTDDRLLYEKEQNIKGIRKISDLKNRCKFANQYPNSILVSIHMNSFGDGKYYGLQTYYTPNDENSRKLADIIQNNVQTRIQNENTRAVKQGDKIFLLNNSEPTSVLIECGFLTNKEECEKLSEKEYQKELSFAIVCGIIEYVEEKTK